jgi:hypothetical protein
LMTIIRGRIGFEVLKLLLAANKFLLIVMLIFH